MSALGEYIHLRYKNYNRYGITRTDPQGKPALNYSADIIDNRLKDENMVSENALNILKMRLKANTSDNINQDNKEWAIQQQKLINEVYTLLQERVSDGKVTGIHKVINIAAGQGWTTRNKQKMKLPTTQNWASTLSIQELDSRKDKAQALISQIQSLITEINKGAQPQSQKNLQTLIQLYEQYTHLSGDSLTDSTIGGIEKAIGEHVYKNSATAIGGHFGEMLVALCDDSCATLAEDAVAEYLEKAVKGQERTQVTFSKDLVRGAKRDEFFLNTSTEDGTKYTLGSTQNKVDVYIQINDEDIFANVKSYAVLAGETPRAKLQNVNLFYSLVFLNSWESYQDFGNHWLNLHTANTKRLNGPQSNRAELDEILKKEIAIEAFSTGNPLKQNVSHANVFVFINRATGDVYVKNIKTILKDDFDNIRGLDSISNIYLKNKKEDRVQDRIYNILNELHQKKIEVAYNIKFI